MPTSRSRRLPLACVAQHGELAHHFAIVVDLFVAAGEVAVPEQHQLFLQRAVRLQHAVGQPGFHASRFQAIGEVPVIELVHDGLLVGFGDALVFGVTPVGIVHEGGPLRGRHLIEGTEKDGGEGLAVPAAAQGGRGKDAGLDESRQVDVLDVLIADQMADGFLRRHGGQGLDLFGRAAEAGAFQQMRGAIVIPIVVGDGGEVADPGTGGGGSQKCGQRQRGSQRERFHSIQTSWSVLPLLYNKQDLKESAVVVSLRAHDSATNLTS